MVDRVGQQIGNYQLIRFLGRGGFAEVYLAEHIFLKNQSAIKLLSVQLTQDDLRAFLQEAQQIASLEHPHIVRVLEFGVDSNVKIPFLVMSYAPGGTLRTLFPPGKQIPLGRTVAAVQQIAAALQYAHDHQLIHRDVKPENLLVGQNNEVFVSDFGIAAAAHSTTSLQTQAYSGTIHYSAPEQMAGKPRPASDQYALGIAVYEWLCGTRPFQGDLSQLVYQHLTVPPPPFKKELQIPPAVEQVVMTALSKDPEQRFVNIQAFAIALEEASQAGAKMAERGLARPAPMQSPQIAAVDVSRNREWTMFGYDVQHTGWNPHEYLLGPDTVAHLILAWAADLGKTGCTSPVVANGLVYIPGGAKLYVVEATTGQLRWSVSVGDSIWSSPAVANGLVYIGSIDAKLYAFEATTGQLRWSASTRDKINSPPTVANGLVYIGSWDHNLYAFEAATGQLRWFTFTGNSIWTSSPAVANGLVYVGSTDHKLYAFEAATGQARWSASVGRSIQSSPVVANGLVYIGSWDHNLYAFEAATGQLRWSASTGSAIDSSPAVANGLVYVGGNDGPLCAFEAATGQPRWSASTGGSLTTSPAVANGLVYVGSWNNLYAFEAVTGQLCWSVSIKGSTMFSPVVANGLVYIGNGNDQLLAFHLSRGVGERSASTNVNSYQKELQLPPPTPLSIPAQRRALASEDEQVLEQLKRIGTIFVTYQQPGSKVDGLAWSLDGRRIASFGLGEAQVWVPLSGNVLYQYKVKGFATIITALTWSPDSTRIATAGSDKMVQIWDANDGHSITTYKGGHHKFIRCVSWSPNGQSIASCEDTELHIWNALSGQHIFTFTAHPKTLVGMRSLAWSPDGTRIASGGGDDHATVWNPGNGSAIFTYTQQHSTINGLAWSPDGKRIVSGSSDKTVHIWEAETGADTVICQGHTKAVNAVAFSPDGQRIASASDDTTVRIWSSETGQHLFTYEGHKKGVNTLAWSPDGKYIASGGVDRTVQVWACG